MKSFLFIILFPAFVFCQENLSGEVFDQNKAIIADAKVVLTKSDGSELKTQTNQKGIFQFKLLTAGKYKLQISAEGFADYQTEFELSLSEKSPQFSIVLYPTIKESIEISETSLVDSQTASGTQTLNAKELAALPDEPEQLSEQLQILAASAGGIPGQATVTVDGFLNSGRLPAKSSIRQVRINPNLFSAEYDTPPYQGGRIEIQTKPGADSLNGSAFFGYNGAIFNARQPLASKKSDNQTRRYGFQIGSAIIRNKAGYFIDFENRQIDESSTVNAIILDQNLQSANFVSDSPNPQRLLNGSARADWQINPNHTAIFRYSFNRNKINGLGIGGTSLAERGFDSLQTENSFRFSETAILSPSSVNELRIGLTNAEIEQNALNNQPAIIVSGAFSAGGANLQNLLRRERLLEIANNLTYDTKKHSLKFGIQIFNRRISETQSENTNGTFYFGGNGQLSSLEQYRQTLLGLAVPTRYSVTIGSPKVSTNQWLFAGFVQDEWRLNQKFLLSLGIRYEGQTVPSDFGGIAPRIGLAFVPNKKQNWVFRVRAGIFYSRISDSLSLETKRFDGNNLRQIMIDSPTFPNPFLQGNVSNLIPTRRIIDSEIKSPISFQVNFEIEKQLKGGWKISGSYNRSGGSSQMLSRNINAPLPNSGLRPLGTLENVFQYESSGRIKGQVVYLGVNQNVNRYFSINAGYLFFDFKTNADYALYSPQSSYDLNSEWATPFWQNRHRVFVFSNANLWWKMRLSASFNANTGKPFNITTGRDNNGDGIFNDRPNLSNVNDLQAISTKFGFLNPNAVNGNLPRNISTNPANATLSFNLSRTFLLGKSVGNKDSRYQLTANIRANNVLNRTNILAVNCTLSSPFFGRAVSAGQSRRIEFGLRFNF